MSAPLYKLPLTGPGAGSTTRALHEGAVQAVIDSLYGELTALATGARCLGGWDPASGGFPADAEAGQYYLVEADGVLDGQPFAVGDWLIALRDGARADRYAGEWQRGAYSQVVPRVYGSPAALAASLAPSRGTGADWQAGGHRYREAAPGAADAHLETQSGVPFYINSGRYDLSAEAWGVRLTGDPADGSRNRIALQRAIDYLDGEGQGGRIRLGSDGDCVVDVPPMLKDNIQIDLGGGQLRNTRGADGAAFLSHQAVQIGKMHPEHMDILPWHKLAAVGFGDDAVTLQTPAEAASYLPGDMVLVALAEVQTEVDDEGTETPRILGGSTKTLPVWAQWNRVHAVSGGVLQLERPMEAALEAGGGTLGLDTEGAWIANVAARTRAQKSLAGSSLTGWLDGAPWMAWRPSLVNGRLSTQFGGAIQGVGMFEGLWQDLRIHPGEAAEGRGFGGVYSNAFAHSRLKGIVSSAYERFIEVKCLSQHSVIEDFEVYAMAHPHGLAEAQAVPISLGEAARDVVFRRGLVNLGALRSGAANSDFNLVNFTPAETSGFERVKFVSSTEWARLVHAQSRSRGCFVRYCDFDAPARVLAELDSPEAEVCDTIFRRFTPGAGRYVLRLGPAASGGQAARNTFLSEGPVRLLPSAQTGALPHVIDNRGITGIERVAGARAVVARCSAASWDQVLGSGIRSRGLGLWAATTELAAYGPTFSLPAGSLQVGDVITCLALVRLSGTGTKTLVARASIDQTGDGDLDDPEDEVFAGTVTTNASERDVVIQWRFAAQSTEAGEDHVVVTALIVQGLADGEISGDLSQEVSVDLLSAPIKLEFLAAKGESGGNITIQEISWDAQRVGFL